MATFSKSTFNAAKYSAARPHYPPALYSHVLGYASTTSTATTTPRTVVDVGCGPGLSTFAFVSSEAKFDHVIGVDPSANMVRHANEILDRQVTHGETPPGRVRFRQGAVDALDQIVPPASVDLVVAGQAAHWFDPLPTYRSLARVLKPGGSFVFWGYGEIFFPDRPELSALIPPYSGGLLGPYWEQPGRSIVENLLVPFPLPLAENFPSSSSSDAAAAADVCAEFDPTSLRRTFHVAPVVRSPSKPSPSSNATSTREPDRERVKLVAAEVAANVAATTHREPLLTKRWTLEEFEAYLGTWSSLHKYQEATNDDNGGRSDVVRGLLNQMEDAGWKRGEHVEASWNVGMLMGTKKTTE